MAFRSGLFGAWIGERESQRPSAKGFTFDTGCSVVRLRTRREHVHRVVVVVARRRADRATSLSSLLLSRSPGTKVRGSVGPRRSPGRSSRRVGTESSCSATLWRRRVSRGERQQSSARALERCWRTTATAEHTCFLIVAATRRKFRWPNRHKARLFAASLAWHGLSLSSISSRFLFWSKCGPRRAWFG